MLFDVIVKVSEGYLIKDGQHEAIDFIKSLCIAEKSNGSIVCMREQGMWLDYIEVTAQEISYLLQQIETMDNTRLQSCITVTIYCGK